MKSLSRNILILLGFCVLTGCTYVQIPHGADPIYCHMNYKFVKQGYYPQPKAMPRVSQNNSAYPYIFPHHLGAGPHPATSASAPVS